MSRFRLAIALAAALALTVVVAACGSSSSSSSGGSTAESSGGETSGGESGGGKTKTLAEFESFVKEKEAPITKWPVDLGAPTEPIKSIESGKLVVDIALSPEEPASLSTAEGAVEAAEALGWNAKIIFTEFSAAKTAAAFEQAIALGADAVITQGIDPKTYKSSIKKLHEAGGILVTTYSDTPPSEEFAQAEVSQTSASYGEIAAAKMIVDGGGKGQFAGFSYPEFKAVENTAIGLEEEFARCEKCELLPIINTASAEAEKTLPTATSTLLQQNPELTGIFSDLDTFLDNFQLPVLRQQGSEVPVYTTLGGKPTLEAVEKGEIKAVVEFPLTWGGWAAIDNVARVFAGQKTNEGGIPKRIVTEENVAEIVEHLGPNGYWEADGFDYKGEYEKLWGLK